MSSTPAFIATDEPVTLTNCDREPIHIPGAIQPHGVLLVLDPDTLAVRQVAGDTAAWFGTESPALIGRPASDILSAPSLDSLIEAAREAGPDDTGFYPVPLDLPGGGGADAVAHLNEAGIVLELEPADPGFLARGPLGADLGGASFPVRQALAALDAAPTQEALFEALVQQVRRLTGFDRVMLYRFDADWHGEVVAEAVEREDLPRYFGLHFPSTDIPQQARALYVRSRLRLIADIGYTPAPLTPDISPATGLPLDMSRCVLRSVSPIHVEYLSNMGVGASMSISILRNGALWGLVACHHYSPYRVPTAVRLACDLVGQVAGMQLLLKSSESERAWDVGRREMVATLTENASAENAVLASVLTAGEPGLMDLVESGGAAVVHEGTVQRIGRAPSGDDVQRVLDVLSVRAAGREVIETDRLGELVPDLGDEARGLLAASLADDWSAAILWFRPEAAQEVKWAGAPKAEIHEPDGTVTLQPRRSFALWREDVRGRSRPWVLGDVRAAEELRRSVIRLVLRRSATLARLNADLKRSNEELDAFAYAASHDLKEPLRGIHHYAEFLLEDYADQIGNDGRNRLESIARMSQRLDDLLDALLTYSRMGRLALDLVPVDMNRALAEAQEQLTERLTGVDVRVPRPLPSVMADRVRLVQVLQNLLSNAAKYGAEEDPWIEVGYRTADEINADPDLAAAVANHHSEAEFVLYVRDNGIGIDPRHHRAIFELYRRLHGRDVRGGGTGAGLTIVRRIAERLGGVVWVDSTPGNGSTFYITLTPAS